MDIFTTNKILLFIVFFVPGFISLKVYDLLIPNDNRNFSESFFDAIAYSAINFGIWFWLLILVDKSFWFWIVLPGVFLISPILLSIAYIKLLRSAFLAKRLINPLRRPWDWFFRKNKSVWVIVNFIDGKKIAGKYSSKSYASSFPMPEQIYLEQVWQLKDDGTFYKPVERSNGVIILGKDISFIEFLDGNEVEND